MMQLLQKSEDAVCGWLRGIDAALLRTVAAAAALCMLLAHGFAFTNLFPNHDSTVLVFDAQWTMYVLGRWAQNLYFPLVRGKIAAPWLIGAFSIVLVLEMSSKKNLEADLYYHMLIFFLLCLSTFFFFNPVLY